MVFEKVEDAQAAGAVVVGRCRERRVDTVREGDGEVNFQDTGLIGSDVKARRPKDLDGGQAVRWGGHLAEKKGQQIRANSGLVRYDGKSGRDQRLSYRYVRREERRTKTTEVRDVILFIDLSGTWYTGSLLSVHIGDVRAQGDAAAVPILNIQPIRRG